MKIFNEAFYDMNLTQSDRIFLIAISGKAGRWRMIGRGWANSLHVNDS